jgi:hypothetical protein
MIDLSSQGHSIGLFYQAQRGVSIFLTANQGKEAESPSYEEHGSVIFLMFLSMQKQTQ